MKVYKLVLTLIQAACIAILIIGCNSNPNSEMNADNAVISVNTEMTALETEQLLLSYLKIKDALVKTDGNLTSENAKSLIKVIGDNKDELAMSIREDAKQISSTNDVERQRVYFNLLSQKIYGMVKAVNAMDAPIYKQYCPMAFENEGAYWLSIEKQVNNPYFGDQMLHCGSVKETIVSTK